MQPTKFVLILSLGAFLVAIGSPSVSAAAADEWAMEIAPESEMSVSGSSTVHDWVCEDIKVKGTVRVKGLSPGSPVLDDLMKHLLESPGAAEAEVTVPVERMHCDKEGMDPKMYKALKAENHPNISYRMTKLTVAQPPSNAGDSFLLNTTGQLTVAGQTRDIDMAVTVSRTGDALVVSGEKALKMTDFKIEKPTAMWGMIKAYDDVTVRYRVRIRSSGQESNGEEE